MVGIIVFCATCRSADTRRPVNTFVYQPAIMAGEPAASRASFAEENYILSKAPEQSRLTTKDFFPLWNVLSTRSAKDKSAVSVPNPLV